MIISQTPFRISFFGGGTDYPVWYKENGGSVLSTTIDKYSFITCRPLPPFFEHKSRIVWSLIELVKDHDEIQHPAAREVLKFMKIEEGVEIHYDGDLPARSGLGSSSSFTVGMLNALYALKGRMASKKQLAQEAIHIEHDRLRENVGVQDQISAAYGGFNRIDLDRNGDFNVSPIIFPKDRIEGLQGHLMLFYTGLSRIASNIAGEQIEKTPEKAGELFKMQELVETAIGVLMGGADLAEFGDLLHETWTLKRSLTNLVSTDRIDEIYSDALKAGAIGGKLLGAGGGGFMLFFVRPDKQGAVLAALNYILHVPFRFENAGSQITFYRSK
jgi:D-glycero-alpha-D-manno-heptose-7-phosphate kinase